MALYNRDWLKVQIKSYLHDSSVDEQLDTWIDLGCSQVNSLLECEEMETEVVRTVGAPEQFIQLPPGTRKLLSVTRTANGGMVHLRSQSRHAADMYQGVGLSRFYRIDRKMIYPYPWSDADYQALILKDVEIPADGTEEVDALSAYPTLYLTAALAEAYDWKQNGEMGQRYTMKWRDLADSITSIYRSEIVGEVPAMRAM